MRTPVACADLLTRRPGGTLAIYLMNGVNIVDARIAGQIGTDWNRLRRSRDLAGVFFVTPERAAAPARLRKAAPSIREIGLAFSILPA